MKMYVAALENDQAGEQAYLTEVEDQEELAEALLMSSWGHNAVVFVLHEGDICSVPDSFFFGGGELPGCKWTLFSDSGELLDSSYDGEI